MPNGTPDYGRSDHAEIVGYYGADGEWHEESDEDWRPPDFEDMEYSEQYVIRLDTEAEGAPDNMPQYVTWNGLMDEFVDLDDIYDYYASYYESLAG